MKWPWSKKDTGPKCEHYYCSNCGGVKTRQTTLLEFDPHMMTPKSQKKITDYIPPEYTTEKVGLKSKPRKYRGNI